METVAALLDGATPLHCAALRGNPAQVGEVMWGGYGHSGQGWAKRRFSIALCLERAEPGLSRGSWMGYCVGRLRGVQVQLTCF